MNTGFVLFAAFVLVPIAEIATFITVGGALGLVPTLIAILATAVIGSFLVRQQGLRLLAEIRTEMEANRLPGRQLVQGAMILVAGILLLTPGFVTDSFGFLLLFPPTRAIMYSFIASRITLDTVVKHAQASPSSANGNASGSKAQYTASSPNAQGAPNAHGKPTPKSAGSDDVIDLDPEDYRDRTNS